MLSAKAAIEQFHLGPATRKADELRAQAATLGVLEHHPHRDLIRRVSETMGVELMAEDEPPLRALIAVTAAEWQLLDAMPVSQAATLEHYMGEPQLRQARMGRAVVAAMMRADVPLTDNPAIDLVAAAVVATFYSEAAAAIAERGSEWP